MYPNNIGDTIQLLIKL